jgi:hypothetical protein
MAMSLAIPVGILVVAIGLWVDGDESPALLVAVAVLSVPLAVADALRIRGRKAPPVVFTLDSSTVTCHRTGRSIAVADLIRVTRLRPIMSRVNSLRFQTARDAITIDLWRSRLPDPRNNDVEGIVRAVVERLPRTKPS